MTNFCKQHGCDRTAVTRFGAYCSQHAAQLRRHGAIGQTGITKAELKPYRELVQARLEKNSDKPLLGQLEARWRAHIDMARAVREEAKRRAMARYKREAAVELLRIGENTEARDVIETVLALYIHQDQEPRRFKGDQAFRTQLVRRVRGLTRLNADAWVDAKTGKRKLVYRDLSQRTVTILSTWMVSALGVAGLHFAKLERRDREREQEELRAYYDALRDVA